MANYVIDENVILNATHGKKADKKTPALEEKIFVNKLFLGKDHLFMNEKIRAKFRKMPQKIRTEYRTEFLDNHTLPLFLKLMTDSMRTTIVDGTPNTFKGIKDCDTEFVGVALQSTSTLVTADDRLKSEIDKDPSISGCRCTTVEKLVHNS